MSDTPEVDLKELNDSVEFLMERAVTNVTIIDDSYNNQTILETQTPSGEFISLNMPNSVTTTLTDNGDGTFTYTAEDGVVTTIDHGKFDLEDRMLTNEQNLTGVMNITPTLEKKTEDLEDELSEYKELTEALFNKVATMEEIFKLLAKNAEKGKL